MKHNLLGGFRRLTLTQQVMLLILLMLAFLTVFFTFFLSDSISATVSRQIFDTMEARQTPVIGALEMGKSASYDRELFDYLAADSSLTTGILTDSSNVLLSESAKNSDEFLPVVESMARQMLRTPGDDLNQGSTKTAGKTMYYRLEKTQYNGRTSIVYSCMDDDYYNSIRTMLMDSTVYITVFAFCLILMVFVFWVFSIIHPLNQIRNYIKQIKQGKDVDLYINRDDEIGEVAKELRTLTAELAKQEKSKEEMIHNISHDLKTPIATIKSYSESIKDGIYPYGDLESSVDVILSNAQRLEDKVHSLLYMNRVEYLVSSDAQGVSTNMKEVVEQVVLNAAVIRPEIEIITDVEEVYFDGLLESWRVCIENIMENAFRYAKTYIKIEVRDNELKISNDGPKMPEDRIDSLFQPYIKGEGGKFGLGLSIVHKVVQANRYKVQGMNTQDGVCFRIYRNVPKPKTYGFAGMQNVHFSSHLQGNRKNQNRLQNRDSGGQKNRTKEAGKSTAPSKESLQNQDQKNKERQRSKKAAPDPKKREKAGLSSKKSDDAMQQEKQAVSSRQREEKTLSPLPQKRKKRTQRSSGKTASLKKPSASQSKSTGLEENQPEDNQSEDNQSKENQQAKAGVFNASIEQDNSTGNAKGKDQEAVKEAENQDLTQRPAADNSLLKQTNSFEVREKAKENRHRILERRSLRHSRGLRTARQNSLAEASSREDQKPVQENEKQTESGTDQESGGKE